MAEKKKSTTRSNLPPEPERDPLPRAVVTPRSAAWMVEQIHELLPSSPELRQSLSDQQAALEAQGLTRVDAVAQVIRELIQMSDDGQPPLDGHDELARTVRVARQAIVTGQWRTEPDPTDVQQEQAARARVLHGSDRLEEAHRNATTIDAPSTVRILDTRGVS